MAIEQADVIVDLQYGDTGKGKIANYAAASGEYSLLLRYNGGGNAGHTFFIDDQKIVTHQVPLGVFYNIPSIIGPGCVVDVPKLESELQSFIELGFTDITKYIMVDKRAHVVTMAHKAEDSTDTVIGTTKQGIGPAYRDKYNRTGQTIEQLNPESPFFTVIDIYDWLHLSSDRHAVLCEGAQGFYLDTMWGKYPYVTSSHCTVATAIQNGIPHNKVVNVFGVAKVYETYVGNNKDFVPYDQIAHDETFKLIQKFGNEYGATTGRLRQVRFLDLDALIQAIHINGVTHLAFNKIDILDKISLLPISHSPYSFVYKQTLTKCTDREEFVDAIEKIVLGTCPTITNIRFFSSEK